MLLCFVERRSNDSVAILIQQQGREGRSSVLTRTHLENKKVGDGGTEADWNVPYALLLLLVT
jgi:hypothetical protein